MIIPVCLRYLGMSWMGMQMSGTLHGELLTKVINAPTNLFFDVTPYGKLLGNFTTGMQKADTTAITEGHWVIWCSL